jgi:hypothetical protein
MASKDTASFQARIQGRTGSARFLWYGSEEKKPCALCGYALASCAGTLMAQSRDEEHSVPICHSCRVHGLSLHCGTNMLYVLETFHPDRIVPVLYNLQRVVPERRSFDTLTALGEYYFRGSGYTEMPPRWKRALEAEDDRVDRTAMGANLSTSVPLWMRDSWMISCFSQDKDMFDHLCCEAEGVWYCMKQQSCRCSITPGTVLCDWCMKKLYGV